MVAVGPAVAPWLSMSPGSASESLSPGPASESLIVAAPTELAPQGPHANLAAGDDDVVDTPHARAVEALKAVKIGERRPKVTASLLSQPRNEPG